MAPWEQQSPLGAAAGAAGAFLQGQEQAKERQQQTQEQQYMDKIYASHMAAEEKIAEDRISEQSKAAELKRVTDEEQNSYRQLEAALRGKYDDAHIQIAEQQLSASIAEHKASIQAALTNREAEDNTRLAIAQLEASTRQTIAQMMAAVREDIHRTSGGGRPMVNSKYGPVTPYEAFEMDKDSKKNENVTQAQPQLINEGQQIIDYYRTQGTPDAQILAGIHKQKYPPEVERALVIYLSKKKATPPQSGPNILQTIMQNLNPQQKPEGQP